VIDFEQVRAEIAAVAREARRAYQRSGRIPDFDALAALAATRRPAV
jgi:hypothetical protein